MIYATVRMMCGRYLGLCCVVEAWLDGVLLKRGYYVACYAIFGTSCDALEMFMVVCFDRVNVDFRWLES